MNVIVSSKPYKKEPQSIRKHAKIIALSCLAYVMCNNVHIYFNLLKYLAWCTRIERQICFNSITITETRLFCKFLFSILLQIVFTMFSYCYRVNVNKYTKKKKARTTLRKKM